MAIIRLSGSQAGNILSRVVQGGPKDGAWSSHRLYLGLARSLEGRVLDEVLAVLMRAPQSYTRQDVAEIHCHGGLAIPGLVVDACVAAGARLARPGEFTLRAFLSGRLDLAQAESVLALIQAGSAASARLAAEGLRGALSRRVGEARRELLDCLSALEAGLDFPDETQDLDEALVLGRVDRSRTMLQGLIELAEEGRMCTEGMLTVVVGPPNAGKSTLWNHLLGEERALVTPHAGTTRDLLESHLQLKGLHLRLVDTAGLRRSTDPVEVLGIGLTQRTLGQAEVLLVILDSSAEWPESLEEVCQRALAVPCVVVLNKADLPTRLESSQVVRRFPSARIVCTCLLQSAGVEVVKEALAEACRAAGAGRTGGGLPANRRQLQALLRARGHLEDLESGRSTGIPLDCLAVDLRLAVSALGEISGDDVTEEVLERIFASFCIGK